MAWERPIEATVVLTSRAGIGGSFLSFQSSRSSSTMSSAMPFLKKYPASFAQVSLRPPSATPRRASRIHPSPSWARGLLFMSSSSLGNAPMGPRLSHS